MTEGAADDGAGRDLCRRSGGARRVLVKGGTELLLLLLLSPRRRDGNLAPAADWSAMRDGGVRWSQSERSTRGSRQRATRDYTKG